MVLSSVRSAEKFEGNCNVLVTTGEQCTQHFQLLKLDVSIRKAYCKNDTLIPIGPEPANARSFESNQKIKNEARNVT